MVIGLHGDSTASVPRAVVEVHSTDEELAITQHLLVVENNVQDHLNKRTTAIRMLAPVKDNLLYYIDCLRELAVPLV